LKIPFKSIAKRLTGFSTPIFGVSWKPPDFERDAASRILTELEDHRAFYAPYEAEFPPFVVDSIINARREITDELKNLDRNSKLAEHLLSIRAACRKFLTVVGKIPELIEFDKGGAKEDGRDFEVKEIDHKMNYDYFWSALGALRGEVGVHIACVASEYGIDVEEELASIFPEEVDDEQAEKKVERRWKHLI